MSCPSYNIFNEAMAAVLQIMDSNFSAEFQESEAYKHLQRVVDEEAEELERLRQVILFSVVVRTPCCRYFTKSGLFLRNRRRSLTESGPIFDL